eukprot:NODE_1461_length_538_cov_101.435583_g1384_i0.p2 GENE.NODE_1461_length_538_cov_101.435583_g1384_i0~~NODE_1461_length_538_cov_101.435583_g1384_i0.p2  ORF type:complete len:63 (-),score=5.96 NODE_1461_length_538_cov_101.435583_g1384_i0:149-337(-)
MWGFLREGNEEDKRRTNACAVYVYVSMTAESCQACACVVQNVGNFVKKRQNCPQIAYPSYPS